MSVLIKGMDMPKNCDDCVLRSLGFGKMFCPITGEDVTNQQFANNCHENCPLVEVPTPHGRLIDADELEETIESIYGGALWTFECFEYIRRAPTIIEAEVSEE